MNNAELWEETRVLNIIKGHKGHLDPIRCQEIASRTGIKSRKVRLIIRELIKVYPIASFPSSPPGYFIAVTQEEVKQYAQSLKKRGLEDLIRRRDFLNSSRTKVEPRQLVLV